jgi:hypothetical protein
MSTLPNIPNKKNILGVKNFYKSNSEAWIDWYNSIKGPNWPNCDSEQQFHMLPDWIQKELINNFNYDPYNSPTKTYKENYRIFQTTGNRKLKVFYTKELDGGGQLFGLDYISILKKHYPDRIFSRCFEWCSGPGFIGYSILDYGICESLCLSDLWWPAIEAAEETKIINSCENQVTTYLLNDIKLLPTYEKFDLIVAAPPHFNDSTNKNNSNYNNVRLAVDYNWTARRNFYANISSHLLPDGVILIQENLESSDIEDFRAMIEENNLQITDIFNSSDYYFGSEIEHDQNHIWEVNRAGFDQFGVDGITEFLKIYYIEIKHKNENIS